MGTALQPLKAFELIRALALALALAALAAQGEEQHRLGLMLEDLQGNMQRVLEVLTPVLKKGERVEAHEAALERQADDLAITKSALRAHISDDTLHPRRS